MKKKTFGQPNKSLPGRISSYLRGHQKIILIGAGFTYILLSFLTFNLRVSEGGDDSAYIIRALRLFEEGRFPKFQGPLYPSILSILVALTGLNIVVLKISSWVFLTISLLLLLKSYSKEASTITIAATGMLLILNHHFLYFGSQTYSEAFFMALQAGFLLFLFHTIQWQKQHRVRITQTAILALFLVSLYLTRTVAIVATPAIIIYFMTQKQWRALLYTTLFVTLFLSAYFLILNTIINIDPTGNDQLTSLLQKHPYDKSQGMETLPGFFVRFWENSKIYLSKHFFILTGYKPAMSLSKPPLPAILLYLFFSWGIIRFYKKNQRFLFFTGIYVAFSVGLTFFALQPLWDQVRLIIPFFPLVLIIIIETIIGLVKQKERRWAQQISLLLISIAILLTGVQTLRQTDFSSVFKNIQGEKLYGYTPDWQNYLKMAEYVAKELPDDSYAACRKPNMARLHSGGKKFYGIYSFNSANPDTLLMNLYERNVSHIMVASLRKNPRRNTGQVINTIHRYMSVIAKKYPQSFILKKQIGENEKAWLFEIDYTRFLENQ
ncbi:hypothetical protein [Marinilabilia salmonicolor]|uniref:hypothetical protein n=1 Tax=Marinilabilia salmonicolor TaxID=989 RepID=UPI00029A4B1E|nr:hypothetical protein [Marinilabilia salmonicolor]